MAESIGEDMLGRTIAAADQMEAYADQHGGTLNLGLTHWLTLCCFSRVAFQ